MKSSPDRCIMYALNLGLEMKRHLDFPCIKFEINDSFQTNLTIDMAFGLNSSPERCIIYSLNLVCK